MTHLVCSCTLSSFNGSYALHSSKILVYFDTNNSYFHLLFTKTCVKFSKILYRGSKDDAENCNSSGQLSRLPDWHYSL